MRLKLVLIASLLAAVIGSGASIAIILGVFASLKPLSSPGLLVLATFVLPTAAVVYAGVFVYRHTARRRKLQAALTVILSVLLCLSAFIAASLITSRLTCIGPQAIRAPWRHPNPGSSLSPSAPDAARRSQNGYARPDRLPTRRRPDEYHRG